MTTFLPTEADGSLLRVGVCAVRPVEADQYDELPTGGFQPGRYPAPAQTLRTSLAGAALPLSPDSKARSTAAGDCKTHSGIRLVVLEAMPSFSPYFRRLSQMEASEQEPADARTRLMEEVAAQMDAIEDDYGEDFQIGRVITIVEVRKPDETVDVRVRAGFLPWVALGMLDWAKKGIEGAASSQGEPSGE